MTHILRHSISSSTGHGTKNDQRSSDGSNNDSGDHNSGNDSKIGVAGLLFSRASSKRVRTVGDSAGSIGCVATQEAVVRLGGASRCKGLIAQANSAKGGGTIGTILRHGNAASRYVAVSAGDARICCHADLVVRCELASKTRHTNIHGAVNIIVASQGLRITIASKRVAAKVQITRISRGRAGLVDVKAAKNIVA